MAVVVVGDGGVLVVAAVLIAYVGTAVVGTLSLDGRLLLSFLLHW